jgi:predicted Zn-dependent peptidase
MRRQDIRLRSTGLAALLIFLGACAGTGAQAPSGAAPPAPAAAAPAAEPAPAAPPAPAEPPAPVLAFPDEAFRNQQPAGGEVRTLKTPALDRFKVGNGISVFLVERHNLPIVSMALVFEGGSAIDPKGKEGLASVCSGLMSDGTEKLDKLAFEEALADIASNVNAGAGTDQHQVSMDALKKNLDATLDLWTDSLLRPGMRQEELDRNLKRRVAGLQQMKGNPAAVAGRLAGSIVYGPEHLFGRFATEGTYGALTLADCKKFVAEHVKPQGAQLFVVGDITKAEIVDKVGSRLKDWKGSAKTAAHPGAPQPRKGKIFFVDMPNAPQSVVQLMHLGPPRKAPDFHPTSVMSGILGGGFTSRINMNVREKHGYAYGARGGFNYTRVGSTFTASASVRTDVTKESVQEILNEIRRMHDGGKDDDPTDEELVREKDGRILALPSQFATGGQILGAFRDLIYYGLPLNYFDTFVPKVRAVDKKSVKQAAVKHLKLGDLRLLVVGDAKTVLPKLKELAGGKELATKDIVVLDADGKPAGG